ncbi:HAUS augmin-like complex subunit 5 [Osmerus eperlanus]|uniref:HAUS augmin-like complex subunit 5 n=1 Tax=Osmerus eperlanus TaxID=29151 RepID=UPI002E1139AB
MGDRNVLRELKRWATEEFNLPAKSLPNDKYFKTLCVGHGASIWKYITQHVYHQRNVRIMRGNLQWYKLLQDKELKQVEGQSEAVRRQDLLQQIQEVSSELNHLDSQISGTEAQLATEEQSIGCSEARAEDSQRRELLLQAFRQRCARERHTLSEHTHNISSFCQTLEELARKAEVEVVFKNEGSNSNSGEYLNLPMAEPQVLCEMRELCEERLAFFQSLQESELKTQTASASYISREDRTKVFQHWLSTVEDVMKGYPPDQVLSALQHLAVAQGSGLEDKLASLDVAGDVEALRFRYENNHLLDISRQEEEELPPVKTLLQAAWEEVEESLMELSQTRARIQQLQNQAQAQRKETELEMTTGQESQSESLALTVLDVELQGVTQAAVRDSVREQCQLMDQQARDRQEALRNLHSQWQSILDFRQLVDTRQEQIRGLIKANSSTKTELTRLHKEVGQFFQEKLGPEFSDVITAADGLRNCVSQEVRKFVTVSLDALDRRAVDGEQRIPAAWLSIHRVHAPSFHNVCQSLDFPLYKAPEQLCSQALSQHLELRFLRHLLRLHSTSQESIQRQQALLPAPDQQALLSRVVEEDKEILQSLLPRIRKLNQRCSQGLEYGSQVKTAITHWWDQPAQLALPEMCQDGLTFQQWLQRWKLAAKTS